MSKQLVSIRLRLVNLMSSSNMMDNYPRLDIVRMIGSTSIRFLSFPNYSSFITIPAGFDVSIFQTRMIEKLHRHLSLSF